MRAFIIIFSFLTLSSCAKYKFCNEECANSKKLNAIDKRTSGEVGNMVDFTLDESFKVVVWNIVDTINPIIVPSTTIETMIQDLNFIFQPAGISFEIFNIEILKDYYTYEALVANNYAKYYSELIGYNTMNMIDLYLVDHDDTLCYNDGRVRGCKKGRGFTTTGGWISSIVLAKEDVGDKKIPAHEFGHFFNLEHTHLDYEKQESTANCSTTGDYICDTPPDPGAAAYGAMVNYTDCEMYGAFDKEEVEYKPLISNYMSYYAPCYMKEYSFTDGQISRMKEFVRHEKRVAFVKSNL